MKITVLDKPHVLYDFIFHYYHIVIRIHLTTIPEDDFPFKSFAELLYYNYIVCFLYIFKKVSRFHNNKK